MIAAAMLTGALAALSAQWSHVNDYMVTIDARETVAGRNQHQVLRYAFRRPDHARLEIVEGPDRGGVVVWRGDGRAIAYRRGLRVLGLRLAPNDRRVVSLRGNGVLTPDFDAILNCFVAHADRVAERTGPILGGRPTIALSFARGAYICPHESAADRAVDRDILYISQTTGLPVLRERYVDSELVERWELRDLRLNVGLTDSAFR